MPVSAQETVFYHVGNGVSVTFAFNCQVLQPADLRVYLNDALTTSGFTVAGIGALTGGSITFASPPANQTSVRIEREVTLERTTDYQQNGDFLARVVNPDFNRIWMAIQQQLSAINRAVKAPKSDSIPMADLPGAALRANKLLSFDPDGNPIAIAPASQSATGISLSLASSFGASLIGWIQSGTGALFRWVGDKLQDQVSAFDFMTPAQIADIRSFTGSIDCTAALQKALDACALSRKVLHLPAGLYRISASLKTSEFSQITGEGRHFTQISGVASGMTTPLVINASPAFIGFTEWRDFALIGGSHSIKFDVTAETAYMNFTNIFMNSNVDNFYVNKMLQTSNFYDCKFSGGNRGVVCAAYTANLNNFVNCEFNNHTFEDVFLQNSEVNNFTGCEFGNVPGLSNSTGIILFNARDCNFTGCYFENGHRRLLADSTSDNGVRFDNCHFTAAINGSYQYFFDSDGVVEFGSNSWYLPSDGAPRMFITGYNQGKLGVPASKITTTNSLSGGRIASGSASTYPAGGQKDLVKFACSPPDNSATRLSLLTGLLTVNYNSLNAGGINNVIISRIYQVTIASTAGLAMTGTIGLISPAGMDTLNGSTLTVGIKAGASPFELMIEARLTGNTTPAGAVLGCALTYDCAASDVVTYIIPSIA